MRDEVLTGAAAIGKPYGWEQRQVYNLIKNQGLPAFKLGRHLAARKSQVDTWLTDLERRTATNRRAA